MYSPVESQPTFERNISLPSSGSNKPSKIPAELAKSFHAYILLDLFDSEDGGDMFLRNVG
jgi:hypothetical protein